MEGSEKPFPALSAGASVWYKRNVPGAVAPLALVERGDPEETLSQRA